MILAGVGPDPFGALIGGAGVAGVWVVTIILGQMHSGKAVEYERQQKDDEIARVTNLLEAERGRNEAELARRQALIDTLLAVYHNEILPVLGDYEKKLAPALAHVEDVLKKMEWIIEQYERRERRGGATEAEEASYYRGGSGARGPAGGRDFGYGPGGGVGQSSGPGGGSSS
ncbi:MAG TPA: hypothetical protein VFI41_05335 [Gemmatimonadales bacterium]|nr:hypothetical protein [Gemmatimonadales bacterium]